MKIRTTLLASMLLCTTNAYAWFLIFPLPNVSKPATLQAIIDALEKSEETRAVAYVSEDKTFSSKVWVWGKYSSSVATQEEADRRALNDCRRALENAKAKSEGGKKLYDFGNKECELHSFTPNEGSKRTEAKRKAEEEERQRIAAIEEAKRVAVEEERKRIADEEKKRLLVVEERQSALSLKTSRIDFTLEATKAAKVLGCWPAETKVAGVENNNVLYEIQCLDKTTVGLSCDQSGLCLKR